MHKSTGSKDSKRLFNNLFNLSCLTDSVSEVVKLSTSYLTLSDNFDLLNIGRMKGPGLLNAYAVGDLTYGEGLTVRSVLSLDNGSLEDLNSGLLALYDAVVNLNGITYAELSNFALKLFVFNFLNDV